MPHNKDLKPTPSQQDHHTCHRHTKKQQAPTPEEWDAFLSHFEKRKVSLGTCGRAFGTPCIHEHACIRCSMLWPDPAQKPRLTEIRDNLIPRITEAEREGWLGEVEGLRISLTAAEHKLIQLDSALQRRSTTTELGMPSRGGDHQANSATTTPQRNSFTGSTRPNTPHQGPR